MKSMILFQILILALGLSSTASANPDFFVDQNFKELFTNYRYGQPRVHPWAGSYFAYATQGGAMDVINGIGYNSDGTKSPLYIYDQLFNEQKTKSFDWERKHHSCDHLTGEEKAGCQGWWGHCNGWAAAAIKHLEPTKSIEFQGRTLEVGHIKGLETELYLTSNSAFMGNTDKSKKTSSWIYDTSDPNYRAFWDVTPRQTFLTFTNHMGAKRLSMVIDRFTGDQVWNQPVVGYRILPIRDSDMGQQNVGGQNVHFVNLRMKIYWANDNVQPGHISRGFDINKTSDDERRDDISGDYDQRLLQFKLFFDGPVTVADGGTRIAQAGNLVGEGYWFAQENRTDCSSCLDQSHPDFIWYPHSAFVDSTGYGNPYLNAQNIMRIVKASEDGVQPPQPPRPPEPPQPPQPPPPQPPQPPPQPPTGGDVKTELTVVVARDNVYDGDDKLIAERLIARIFRRSGLSVDVSQDNISFEGSNIRFKVVSASGMTIQAVKQSLEDAQATVISIE